MAQPYRISPASQRVPKNRIRITMSHYILRDFCTSATSIRMSSQPKARTIYERTKHLSETVVMDKIIKVAAKTKRAKLRPSRGIGVPILTSISILGLQNLFVVK